MAAIIETPERGLVDYILDISERAEVRVGSPLPDRVFRDPFKKRGIRHQFAGAVATDLRDVKIIAEAWDAAGAYEVGII
jgi:hypothetical protein